MRSSSITLIIVGKAMEVTKSARDGARGQGGAAPDFYFCTLYRLRKWQNGELVDVLEKGTPVPMGAGNLKKLLGS